MSLEDHHLEYQMAFAEGGHEIFDLLLMGCSAGGGLLGFCTDLEEERHRS